jgi:hypothetical protein
MSKITRIGAIAFVIGLGLAAAILLSSSLSVEANTGEVDLMIELKAPASVPVSSTYVVNLSYANKGTAPTLDNWVTVTLPAGTQFITSTYIGGAPYPPDQIDGDVLTWIAPPLPADSTWQHILIVLQTDADLPEGTVLTVTAEVATTAPEPDTSDNTATVASVASEMGGSMKQVSARHCAPGDVLTYTITVDLSRQFGGSKAGEWVTITDTLPFSHQVCFLGWSGTVTGTQVDSHTLRWQAQVRAGEPMTFQYRLGVRAVVTPGTVITNVAMLGWTGHQMQLRPVTTVVSALDGVLALDPYQGGLLTHTHGITVEIPPGAVTGTTQFRLGPLYTDTWPTNPPGGLFYARRALALNAYRFGTPVGQFNHPLTITMNMTDAHVAGLKRETLQVWTRQGPAGPWSVHGAPVRAMSGTVTFTTTHLSEFALFAEPKYRAYLPLVRH